MPQERNGLIYLDHAATTAVHQKALEAMLPYFSEKFFNPSSMYAPAQACRHALERARHQVAQCLGCKPTEIIFTSGGTESDNAAIKGSAEAMEGQGRHIITTAIEHHAVLHTCQDLEDRGYRVTYLPVDGKGMVDPDKVEAAITPETTVVSIMLANNEIGTIEPIPDIAAIVKAKAKSLGTQIILHTDAVQGAAYLDLTVDRLGVDSLSLSAHKFNGPKGVGILYLRKATPFEPQQVGGSHERNRRAGTENVAGIVGAATALTIATEERDSTAEHCLGLRERLIKGIRETIPKARLNGHETRRLPNNVNFSFEGTDSQWTLMALDEAGIAASTGSACRTASLDPSHVLIATGVPANRAIGTLRLTLGQENTVEQIDHVLKILPDIIANVRRTDAGAEAGGAT
ncbi:MAG: aminotransferase class V-fold PLP-dependent enzyme [Chloroflexi bacterium]|nr:aminotransferase class V-fold PLP-dependent enzyme [Chloroflexota bacterium]